LKVTLAADRDAIDPVVQGIIKVREPTVPPAKKSD
jgi:hypothetical protein